MIKTLAPDTSALTQMLREATFQPVPQELVSEARYEFRDQEEELAPSPDLEAPTALRDLMAAVEADGLSPKGFLWVSSPQEVSVPRRSLLRLVTSVAPRNPR
jgi:hypothetical protein